jgi:NAD+ diphosphatase
MLGCIAEAADPTITVDKRELEDARWFTRDEIKDMLARSADDSGLRLAPPGTIAHELCRAFAEHHPICNF